MPAPKMRSRRTVLESVRRGTRPEGLLNTGGARADQLPMLTVDHPRSQAYLKSAREMWRLFGKLPAALEATSEIANRCRFRLPLAGRTRPTLGMGRRCCSGSVPCATTTTND